MQEQVGLQHRGDKDNPYEPRTLEAIDHGYIPTRSISSNRSEVQVY